MALWRVLTSQLSRGFLVEHSCTAQPHIHKSTLDDSIQILRSCLQTASEGGNWQRAIRTLHEASLPNMSSTTQSSAAAARSSLMQSSSSRAPQSYTALSRQPAYSSTRCFSIAPALVRRWQPGAALDRSGHLASIGSSTVRGFTSQAQRSQQRRQLQKKSSEQGVYLVALVVGMVGLTYASVPLYRMFCQATGFGGTVQEGSTVEDKLRAREENPDEAVERAAAAREVTVSFNADVADGMPWRFVPAQRSVKVHPGQSTLIFYNAHNTSDKAITGVSTYNVAPQQAGFYFNKIQCFCFEEQKLRPGEKIDMPVFFYIDPEFATDPRMNGINHLTLSYTFFNVEEEAVEVDGEIVPAAELLGRQRHMNPAHAG